jgi:hypothetical protein
MFTSGAVPAPAAGLANEQAGLGMGAMLLLGDDGQNVQVWVASAEMSFLYKLHS